MKLRIFLSAAAVPAVLSAAAAAEAKAPPPVYPPVGGANAPAVAPPPKPVLALGVLECGSFAVKVPTGRYQAPPGGVSGYVTPGPIAAFRGADGAWRGWGYLETLPRLAGFTGTLEKASAVLEYRFAGGGRYRVRLRAADGAVLLDEQSDLGPRNLYVFDCAYGGWQPGAGFAVNLTGERHAFLYLPCYYDKPEVTINPAAAVAAGARPAETARQHGAVDIGAAAGKPPARPADSPAAVAVVAAEPEKRDIAGFFCRQVASWKNADRMGIQLWQRRQVAGDPAGRHFLGPETKSDSTPNPRTAGMLGRSLYEAHVTIELALGSGTRKLGFTVVAKPPRKADLPEPFKKVMRANLK